MAKKDPAVVLKKPLNAAHEQVTAKELQTAFEVSDGALLQQKVNEIAQLLWVREDASDEKSHQRVIRALQLYESLEPADGAEGMLATQMVGTHDAALECLKRAALPNQTFAGRDMALKHAHKLMTLYTQQLATLNKHRGKGQQRVTVEHVNVEAGGQAIVGNVDAGAARRQKQSTSPEAPEALEHAEPQTLDMGRAKQPAKTRKP